ncbi:MAG: hypothetical protein WBS20_01525 [Lysobacterales bacterium]
MKNLLKITFVLATLANPPIGSAAEGTCSPLTNDPYTIIPQDWIAPGDYKVWNTDCGHYVFNYINRPEDATYHNTDTGKFFNYGFATNTITELDADQYNFTVAAQINGWSLVRSGVHNLFGAAIETVNTPEGDALTTMVATESQVNSRHSENHAPKVGIDTVLYTAHGDDDSGIGSDKYNVNSRAHFISATPSQKGEHYGWETGIYVSRYGLGTSVDRNFKTLIDLEQVPDSVCLMTFTRNNGKIGCLRYNIELDQMEIVGDIHNNSDIKVFQTFTE